MRAPGNYFGRRAAALHSSASKRHRRFRDFEATVLTATVDLVRPLHESVGVFLKRPVEHGAHHQPQRHALELIGDEELDHRPRLSVRPRRLVTEAPAIVELAEWPVDIADLHLKPVGVADDAAG